MHMTELRLLTDCLAEQKNFYMRTLGLALLSETETSVMLGAGTTRLVFLQAEPGTHPFYHFAFNVPGNKFTLAKAWSALRCPLLKIDNVDQVTHQAWNAQSFYFYDSAGNVVEFIARYNLPNHTSGEFDSHDLLNVSEIGLVVDDVYSTIDDIEYSLGERIWKEKSDTFAAMGDDNGLLIIAKLGRMWILTDKPAEVHPVALTIQGSTPLQFKNAELPYYIDVATS
jgi:catechol 2,3-dioxygenase-like lactoylglutathione lyase family enzyme